MATSKHFLEQVKTGDVAAALQTALGNAGSLRIVTYIAGAGSADDLPDSHKISTHIDAVAGTIETSVGENFVHDGNFKSLCDGHMQQVVAGCSSVRDNLDTIQSLLDWVSEASPGLDGSTSVDQGNSDSPLNNGSSEDAAEPSIPDNTAGAVGLAAAGLGTAAVAASSPAEDSMLDSLDAPSVDGFGDASGLDDIDNLATPELDAPVLNENAPLEGLALDESNGELGLDENFGLDGSAGQEPSLSFDEGLDLGDDSLGAPELKDDPLGLDLGSDSNGEDAGPATEFLVADNGEESTQLVGADEGAYGDVALDAPGVGTPDLVAEAGDASDSSDPLAGLELGDDLGGAATPSDDPFNLGNAATAETPANPEEDTLAGVSWAESGSNGGDLALGSLDLEDNATPEAAASDPEVDDLALDAIGDFDSGMWDEASAETVDLKEGEPPAKVSRSLESLFSADETAAPPSNEGESGGNDPLSALFSDTSLEDIPSEPSTGGESQETLASNPFEIDDLENDPFADLMLEDPNS